MKRIRLVVVTLLALTLLAAAAGLRRVDRGEEAVRVARDGSTSVARAGWHFLGPGARLVRYPLGERTLRVPAAGSVPVVLPNGDSLGVAFEFSIVVPAGASESLYRGFSPDFVPAFGKLVVSAAAFEAMALADPKDEDALRNGVVARVSEEMGRFGITVRDGVLVHGGGIKAARGG
jgi:hypothetical protein